jgi:hypothetical protein
MEKTTDNVNQKINQIDVTNDTITSRGGMAFISRYIENIGILQILYNFFQGIRKRSSGTPIITVFKQLLCFFIDGTSFALSRFDELKYDEAYASSIETNKKKLISSHTVKRFLKAFTFPKLILFRKIYLLLFMWRLKITKPKIIKLGIDTKVLDNDGASKREGVSPTYKKVKGFHPILMYWGRYIVDAIFRGGKKSGNHENTVVNMIRRIVKEIRKTYDPEVPILIAMDAGFYDEKIFEAINELGIGFVIGGRIYNDIKIWFEQNKNEEKKYKRNKNTWVYADGFDQRGTWEKEYRMIYTRLVIEEDQGLLEFEEYDSVFYTNITVNSDISKKLERAGIENPSSSVFLIQTMHNRAKDELVNRAIEDFGTAQMPFKRFQPNSAFFYVMILSYLIFTAFKEDIGKDQPIIRMYANSFRRRFIDFAAKIVRTGKMIILKVTNAVVKTFDVFLWWERCNTVNNILKS